MIIAHTFISGRNAFVTFVAFNALRAVECHNLPRVVYDEFHGNLGLRVACLKPTP